MTNGGYMISNSFFYKFDRSSFKAFYLSAIELSFTRAAQKGGSTQSGVSQHISKLEDELQTTLFLRQKSGLKLTEAGRILKDYLERVYKEEERFLGEIHKNSTELTGQVSYAMPESCLMSPHFGMMLEEKKSDFPLVELSVQLHDSETVFNKVLNGDIDFGFITQDIEHPLVDRIPFCQENYVLISANKAKLNTKELKELDFIFHPDFESLYEVWFKRQFPRKKVINSKQLHFTGNTNRIPACLNMVAGGMGLTILPEHCASALIESKQIKAIKEFEPAQGTIHIIHRKNYSLPNRVKKVINTFLSFYDKCLRETKTQ